MDWRLRREALEREYGPLKRQNRYLLNLIRDGRAYDTAAPRILVEEKE